MELRDYLRILRRRWTLIVGCVVAALAVATLVTVRATPQYASNARIFISTGSASSSNDGSGSNPYQNGLAATQKVTSYAQLVTDGELAQRVIDKMHLDLTPAQLSRKIKAQVVPDTVLLKVQVVDADPKMAQAICKQVVSNLLDLIEQIETDPGKKTANLKGTVVGPPTLPTDPISPNPLRNLFLGGILGLLLGLAIAVIRELLDTSVKTVQDVEAVVDAPVLGGIAFDANTTRTPLVSSLSSHAPRVEAFRVLRTNLQFVDIDAGSKVFVVTSSVPGEGKSSRSNVAIAMAQAGRRSCSWTATSTMRRSPTCWDSRTWSELPPCCSARSTSRTPSRTTTPAASMCSPPAPSRRTRRNCSVRRDGRAPVPAPPDLRHDHHRLPAASPGH